MTRKKDTSVLHTDEARWDAETLARAEEIRSNRNRFTAAQAHARKEAQKYAKIGAARTTVKTAPARGKK